MDIHVLRGLNPRLFLAPLALALACSEYDLKNDDDAIDIPESEECTLVGTDGGSTTIDPACESESADFEIEDPWNLGIEWQYTVPDAKDNGVIVMPAIGNLTDDDGDGYITEFDDPDVAFVTWGNMPLGTLPGTLVALHGDGSLIFEQPGYNGTGGVTIADVDNDGATEIIALTASGQVAAVAADGEPRWLSDPVSVSMYPQSTVADLRNDGSVQIIFDTAILSGENGAIIGNVDAPASSWRTPVVADVDQDGTREIIIGNVVADPSGSTLWTNPGLSVGNFAAVADVDGDPEGEVLFVSGSTLYVHDDDGTLLRQIEIPGVQPGPPCMADFDGDGKVEIAIPANYAISVWNPEDGTKVWQAPMSDPSGLAGCSGYDMNGDGVYEVLFADETDLRFYDGRTGEVLYDNPTHDSGTLWEYPVIADVDNDGSAEVLIASNSYSDSGGYRGVTAFGHLGTGWPKSGPTWGTHDFAVTNLNADGTVPRDETPSWQVHNTFRARPSVDQPGVADVYVITAEPCLTACDGGVIQIPWQVGNHGGAAIPAGLEVQLLAVNAGVATEIATATTPRINPGALMDGQVFEVPAEALAGADAFIVRVDPEERLADCNPDDDELQVDIRICL